MMPKEKGVRSTRPRYGFILSSHDCENARRSSKAVTFQYHSTYVDKEFLSHILFAAIVSSLRPDEYHRAKKAEELLKLKLEELTQSNEEL